MQTYTHTYTHAYTTHENFTITQCHSVCQSEHEWSKNTIITNPGTPGCVTIRPCGWSILHKQSQFCARMHSWNQLKSVGRKEWKRSEAVNLCIHTYMYIKTMETVCTHSTQRKKLCNKHSFLNFQNKTWCISCINYIMEPAMACEVSTSCN